MWISIRSRFTVRSHSALNNVSHWFLVLALIFCMQNQQDLVSANSAKSPSLVNKIQPSLYNEEHLGNKVASEHCRAELRDEDKCPSTLESPSKADEVEMSTGESKGGQTEAEMTDDDELSTGEEVSSPGIMLRKGVEDLYERMEKSGVKVIERLEGVMDKVAHSKDRMIKKLDRVMDQVSESVSDSKSKMLQGIDSMMDKVSESMSDSRSKVIQGIDSVMDKMTESKDTMMKSLDDVLDKVAHSKMLEEIDHVLDKVAHSKVMEEIRALPEEIRQSFVLSTRNHSYIAAGIMVAITTAILMGGAVYFSWCHKDEAWAYYLQPLHGEEQLVCTQHTRDAKPVVSYKKVPQGETDQGDQSGDESSSENDNENSSEKDNENSGEKDKENRREKDNENSGGEKDPPQMRYDAWSSSSEHLHKDCNGQSQSETQSDCQDIVLNSKGGKNCGGHHSLDQIRHRKIKSNSSDIRNHHQSVKNGGIGGDVCNNNEMSSGSEINQTPQSVRIQGSSSVSE